MENYELNEDLLIEIFSRLPAKSVGKFRCLSKAWCTHLSTSQFINLHLSIRKNNQSQLFLEIKFSSRYICIPRIEDAGATTEVELPFSSAFSSVFGVVDSCNGLVLISSWDARQFILVNPITLQHVQVPIPKSCAPRNFYGFGYDSCSDDYKIVIYHCCGDSSSYDVYSLKSKVWKRVSSSPKHPIITIITGASGVFTNGAIHWISISSDTSLIIASFNLSDEVFYYISLPASARDWKIPSSRLYILEGCLCVIDKSAGSLKTDIWVMKEYRVHDSWTKFTVNTNYYRLTFQDGVIMYDLVEGTAKHMIRDRHYSDGVAFSDSLVSL